MTGGQPIDLSCTLRSRTRRVGPRCVEAHRRGERQPENPNLVSYLAEDIRFTTATN